MKINIASFILLTQIFFLHPALHKKNQSDRFVVHYGSLKGKEIIIVESTLRKWNSENIWSHQKARTTKEVKLFFEYIITTFYPNNLPAQHELRKCYNEAPDLRPLLPAEFLSKEYFFVKRDDTPNEIRYLVPREWLTKK